MPVLVTRDFPPGRGGIQRYCQGLAQTLHELSGDLRVVAPYDEGAAAFDEGLPYPVLRVKRSNRLLEGFAFVQAIQTARRAVRDRRVIAAIWQPCGYEAMLAGAIGRKRLIVICHGTEITKQRRGLRSALASLILANSDTVAVSRFTAAAVRALRGTPRIVPIGIPTVALRRRPTVEPTVLIVGRLVRRKGFDSVIQSIASLSSEFPNIALDVVGEGPDRNYLQDIATKLNVRERVRFHGGVSEEELSALYSSAWCFAMPNRTESGFDVEGLGIVFLEAAMHGIPAIGGINSGAEDAIVNGVTGLLVDGSSQDEVTAAVRRLVSDPRQTESLGLAARERVIRDFNWTVLGPMVIQGTSD